MRPVRVSVLLGVALALLPLPSRGGAGWEEITPEEKALTEVSFSPGAPAVILKQDVRFRFSGDFTPSRLEFHRRLKILKEEGREAGAVFLPSFDFLRISNLEGRTVLPDGTVIPLSRDAVSRKGYSPYYGGEMVSFVMPGVVPGAIVDYAYHVNTDQLFWRQMLFQDRLPMLISRISYVIPRRTNFDWRYFGPRELVAAHDLVTGARTVTLEFALKSVPEIPEEPSSPPLADRSARIVFDPVEPGEKAHGTRSWEPIVAAAQAEGFMNYRDVRRFDGDVRRKAAALAVGAQSGIDKARACYQFVRDAIATSGHRARDM